MPEKRKKYVLKLERERNEAALLQHPIRVSYDLRGAKKTFKRRPALKARIRDLYHTIGTVGVTKDQKFKFKRKSPKLSTVTGRK